MIKVLIADDEAILCNGIKNSIDWGLLGAQVVATACDGEDALGKIRENQPDICLLDVRMPFVSGLDVAKRYIEEKPDGIAIMITGYDEAAYARSALNTGAFGYILKPVNEDELLETVQRAVKKLCGNREKDESGRRSARIVQNNLGLLRDAFLQNWLAGKMDIDAFLADCPLHSVEIPQKPAMLLLHLPKEQPGHLLQDSDALPERAQVLLEEYLEGLRPFFTVNMGTGTIAAVHDRDSGGAWFNIPSLLHPALKRAEINAIILQKDFETLGETPGIYTGLSAELEQVCRLSPITNALKQYAEQNFRDPKISLKDFAELHGTTSSYLSRLFRQETGVTFGLYLSHLRVSKSLHYLKNPNMKICSIAELCGYSSQHYYCESFGRVMGVSPSEYRKSLKMEYN